MSINLSICALRNLLSIGIVADIFILQIVISQIVISNIMSSPLPEDIGGNVKIRIEKMMLLMMQQSFS
jgi:hypothetical protein